MMGRSNPLVPLNPLTLQYIDPGIILSLSNPEDTNEAIGLAIREYLISCSNSAGNNILFYKHSPMRKIANTPAELAEIINNLNKKNNE